MLPLYFIDIDLDDPETKVEFNSIVDRPAHMRSFESYGEKKSEFFVDKKEWIITGVMIAEGTPIYRNDKQFGEHLVVFTKESIRKMWLLYNRMNLRDNVNKQHNPEDVIQAGKKIYSVEQWIVNRERGMGVPKSLEHQSIRDGSWMMSYKVDDPKTRKEIEDGIYTGFSIEGVFLKYPVMVKKRSSEDLSLRGELRELLKKIKSGNK